MWYGEVDGEVFSVCCYGGVFCFEVSCCGDGDVVGEWFVVCSSFLFYSCDVVVSVLVGVVVFSFCADVRAEWVVRVFFFYFSADVVVVFVRGRGEGDVIVAVDRRVCFCVAVVGDVFCADGDVHARCWVVEGDCSLLSVEVFCCDGVSLFVECVSSEFFWCFSFFTAVHGDVDRVVFL